MTVTAGHERNSVSSPHSSCSAQGMPNACTVLLSTTRSQPAVLLAIRVHSNSQGTTQNYFVEFYTWVLETLRFSCTLSNARFRTKQLSSSAGVRTKQGTYAVAHKRQTSESDSGPSAALSAAKRTACCNTVNSLGHRRSSPCEASRAALDRGQLLFCDEPLD